MLSDRPIARQTRPAAHRPSLDLDIDRQVQPTCTLMFVAIDRYREAQQIIAQLLLSRAEQPRRDEYRAAVLCLHGTILQLVTASVPRRYLEVLISGKRPWQCLQICRSTQYDLLDREGRKGTLAQLWIVLDFVIPPSREAWGGGPLRKVKDYSAFQQSRP